MSIDLSQFSEVFFEEAAEHLVEMEELLLACDVSNPDAEELNAIFRAAHSIKGGAGAFGFTELSAVTHVLETLLDRIRKKELPLRAEMVDAFLKARDVLSTMMAAYREGTPLPQELIAATTRHLASLTASASDALAPEALTARSADGADGVDGHGDGDDGADGVDPGPNVAPPPGCLQVRIAAGPAVDDEGVVSCLKSYGELLESEQGNAERPWRYVCRTSREAADVHETLTFLINPDRLTIDTAHEPVDESVQPVCEHEYDGYGFFVAVSDAHPRAQAAPAPPSTSMTAIPSHSAHQGAAEAANTANAVGVTSATAAKPVAATGSSIRVSVEKIDQLLNLVGELVITQSMLAQTAVESDPAAGDNLTTGIGQLERNSRELQEAVMSIRMLPISSVFNRFPRVVRDLAKQLGKEVELHMVGENTELDKGFIEKLSDPMMHLVRNSVDHGIEMPDVRERRGKARMGRLTLRAYQQGSDIAIQVADDGGGLDRARILAKARENGLVVAAESLSDQEVWLLIFEPGFSTAAAVTDVSGRGVGMDVVRRNIQSMGGRIEIESTLGAGTTLSIRLPLTLAILDGMSVLIGGERYIVPLTFIIEAVMPAATDIKSVQASGRVINVRGEFLPLVSLSELFGTPAVAETQSIALILRSGTQKMALLVDELLGQHQVVIKSLESNYRRVPGAAGATIMGDGRVAIILDVTGLIASARRPGSLCTPPHD